MNSQKKKICVVTSGHMASTPRMLKAADAFHEAGYEVRMVCAEQVDWCIKAGIIERAKRSWKCRVVDWHPVTGKGLYHWSRLRHYLAKKWIGLIGVSKASLPLLNAAQNRVGKEVLAAVLEEPFDLIYGGTMGGVTIAYLASIATGKPFAIDFEDYHPGEGKPSSESDARKFLFNSIVKLMINKTQFITCGSSTIAKYYQNNYKLECFVINNVFSLELCSQPVANSNVRPLNIVWFSQRIGPNRGIEDILEAAKMVFPIPNIFLIGSVLKLYKENILDLATKFDIKKNINFIDPMSQNKLLEFLNKMDCGLAVEPGSDLNNEILLSNKIFTYMMSGLGLVITKTRGQNEIIKYLKGKSIAYDSGDIFTLTTGIQEWSDKPETLKEAKQASWEAAKRRWHWEHPEEKGKLLNLINKVFEY